MRSRRSSYAIPFMTLPTLSCSFFNPVKSIQPRTFPVRSSIRATHSFSKMFAQISPLTASSSFGNLCSTPLSWTVIKPMDSPLFISNNVKCAVPFEMTITPSLFDEVTPHPSRKSVLNIFCSPLSSWNNNAFLSSTSTSPPMSLISWVNALELFHTNWTKLFFFALFVSSLIKTNPSPNADSGIVFNSNTSPVSISARLTSDNFPWGTDPVDSKKLSLAEWYKNPCVNAFVSCGYEFTIEYVWYSISDEISFSSSNASRKNWFVTWSSSFSSSDDDNDDTAERSSRRKARRSTNVATKSERTAKVVLKTPPRRFEIVVRIDDFFPMMDSFQVSRSQEEEEEVRPFSRLFTLRNNNSSSSSSSSSLKTREFRVL